MFDQLTRPGAAPRRTWGRATSVIVGMLAPVALVVIAPHWLNDGAAQSSAAAAARTSAASGHERTGPAADATTTRVAPVVVPSPPATKPAPSTPSQVVVSGRVRVEDGGLVADVAVGFQHPDCPECVRYTATTDTAGGYRLTLPEGRYRASCIPSGIRAYCLPVGASFEVTLDQPTTKVDFRIAVFSSGRDGVGARTAAPLPTPQILPRDHRPRIIIPFVR